MKKKKLRRPVGLKVIAWLLIAAGILHAANEVLGRLWNATFGEHTKTFIVVGAPIGVHILLFGSILLGIGMLRLSRVAYVLVCIISSLFLLGSAFLLVDSFKNQDNIELAISFVALSSSIAILIYLGRKTIRKNFFSS
jgi:hypothetical protein